MYHHLSALLSTLIPPPSTPSITTHKPPILSTHASCHQIDKALPIRLSHRFPNHRYPFILFSFSFFPSAQLRRLIPPFPSLHRNRQYPPLSLHFHCFRTTHPRVDSRVAVLTRVSESRTAYLSTTESWVWSWVRFWGAVITEYWVTIRVFSCVCRVNQPSYHWVFNFWITELLYQTNSEIQCSRVLFIGLVQNFF